MKIALLLTGHTRTYANNFASLKKFILDQYDVDIYCCTWNRTQQYHQGIEIPIHEKYTDLYSKWLKGSLVLDVDDHLKSKPNLSILNNWVGNERAMWHIAMGWHERLYDQWYLVNKCFQSIPNKESYDMFFRCRFDIEIFNMTIHKYNGIVIPRDMGGWDFSDHMAYGDLNSMSKYCTFVNHIQNMHNEYQTDISHANIMLKFYILNYGQPIETKIDESISYTIRK
jgi:hypothetical protein